MLAQFIIAFVILGLLAGLTSGLAGVGSTLLILPTLFLLLPHYMPADLSVKIAIATTLACTSVSVIFAAVIHIRKRNVDVRLCLRMATVYVLTAVVGAYIVHFSSPNHRNNIRYCIDFCGNQDGSCTANA